MDRHPSHEAKIREDLQDLIGDTVVAAVSVYGMERNGFFTQMSIEGKLEGHSEDDDIYRIVNSQRTYTYFRVEDVIIVNVVSSPTIIHLVIDQRNNE